MAADLLTDGKGWILFFVSAGHLLTLGTRLVYPALLPSITEAFDLTLTTAGGILSLMWIAFALAQVPGGIVTDRIGERATLAAAILGSAVGVAVVAGSPSFGVFLVGLIVFGVASGLYGTPRITVLSDVFPSRDGVAIGLQSAAGNVGTAALPVVAAAVAGVLGWRAGVGYAIPLFLAVAAGIWFAVPVRTSPPMDTADEATASTARRVVGAVLDRSVLIGTLAMAAMMFVYQTFTGFLPTFLVETKGFDQGTAATMLGVFFASAVVFQPLAGGFADRYGQRRLMGALAGVTVVTVGAFPLVDPVPAVGVLAAVAGAQLGFWPPAFAYVTALLPDELQGSGLGLLRTAFLLFGASGPVIVGRVADAGYFPEAFFSLAALAALPAGLSALLPADPNVNDRENS
jgi:MFS family permease